jgi:hypothetical protein
VSSNDHGVMLMGVRVSIFTALLHAQVRAHARTHKSPPPPPCPCPISKTPACLRSSCVAIDGVNAFVTIPANDDPHGVVAVSGASVSSGVAYEGSTLSLAVERTRGAFGNVSAVLVVSSARYTIAAVSLSSAVLTQVDVHTVHVACQFADGANTPLAFQVTIGDNNVPEDNSTLALSFVPSSLTGDVSSSSADPVTLTVVCNDDPNGVIGFPVSLYSGAVENSTVNLTVTRSLGLFGAVSAGWIIRNNASDFEGLGFGTVNFAANQSTGEWRGVRVGVLGGTTSIITTT